MSRIGIIFLAITFHSGIKFVGAVECQGTRPASIQLETYYTWWYRCEYL